MRCEWRGGLRASSSTNVNRLAWLLDARPAHRWWMVLVMAMIKKQYISADCAVRENLSHIGEQAVRAHDARVNVRVYGTAPERWGGWVNCGWTRVVYCFSQPCRETQSVAEQLDLVWDTINRMWLVMRLVGLYFFLVFLINHIKILRKHFWD